MYFQRLKMKPIEGIRIKEVRAAENFDAAGDSASIPDYKPAAWLLECDGPPASLYEGECFKMQVGPRFRMS